MKHLIDRIGALAFLLLLAVALVVEIREVVQSDSGVDDPAPTFRERVQKRLVGNLWQKKRLVTLNGGFVRLLGQRICNEVIRLNNGQLDWIFAMWRSEDEIRNCPATNIVAFARLMKDRGRPFLYVQAPCSEDLGDHLRPYTDGHPSDNVTAERICGQLAAVGADVLDLRPVFAATPEQVTANFIRTDHHWTIDTAFAAFPMITKALLKSMGRGTDQSVDEILSASAWTRREMKRCSLGSPGRRVGTLFATLDDISWYEPKFKTEMSCSIPSRCLERHGSFREALIVEKLFSWKQRHKVVDWYNIYIGGNFPLVEHRNRQAPVKARILLVKDSFAIPIQAFLSTVFSDIDVIDLRYYEGEKLPDYIERTKPDAVVVLYAPTSLFNGKLMDFGRLP